MQRVLAQLLLTSFLASGSMLVGGPVGSGGSGGPTGSAVSSIQGLAQKELERRKKAYEEALFKVLSGRKQAGSGDLAAARDSFRAAVDMLEPSPSTLELRSQALEGFATTTISIAFQRAEAARYDEARDLLTALEDDDYDRWRKDADTLMKRLGDPERYNPAVTPEHLDNTAEVVRLLHLAAGLTDIGFYDEAADAYNSVLRIDRYNAAAQRGLEATQKKGTEAHDAGRSQMRAEALGEVDSMWVPAIKSSGPTADILELRALAEGPLALNTNLITTARLDETVIPRIDFLEAPLSDVAAFLTNKTREENPEGGINIVIRGGADYANREISLTLQSMPLSEVLRYVARQAEMRVDLSEYAVEMVPLNHADNELLDRTWVVPPTFIQSMPVDTSVVDDPFAEQVGAGGGGTIQRRLTAKEFLENQGISFPEGATAFYNPSNNKLTVRNTLDTLDFIDQLVELSRGSAPKQVEIQVKIVDVRQDNLKELGFDWLLGQFNLGGDELFGSGGTIGNTPIISASDFPTTFPGGGAPVGVNPITAGNRGLEALTLSASIDDLISGIRNRSALGNRSPGVLALTGAFTDPQFQTVLRGLSQSKGTDFLAAPVVVARSGQRAKIEVIREFPYPVEFEPPEIPESFGTVDAVNGGGGQPGNTGQTQIGSPVPYVPTTPTAFEIENLGVTLEVEAVIGEDNRTVDVQVAPVISRFDGFIDYGSAITSPSNADPTIALEQPNAVLQPVFSIQRSSTSVTIYDQTTLVMAGTLYSKISSLEDQHPLFGRVPGAGRLFQSDAEIVGKRNVIMFVTVRIVDPAGNLVNSPTASPRAEAENPLR